MIRVAATTRILVSSARIALVVGLLLNGINQGNDLWEGKALHVGHFLLNFFVPFCVSSYSAAKNELNRRK
ncbi:MAG: hypothetical protein HYS18_12320 [Burkholderiales bacterium]|nr:hypothetical protein [Burkholderiales bacterium]